jgi:hypothetical protein
MLKLPTYPRKGFLLVRVNNNMKLNTRNFISLVGASLATSAALVYLQGCAPKPEIISKDFISAEKVRGIMWGLELNAINEFLQDSEYGLPTEDWITRVLYPAVYQSRKNDGEWIYQKNSHDCDDYAAEARVIANKLNNKTSNRGIRGIAFGEYHYMSKRLGGQHALNFGIIKKDNNDYKIVFFEPQDGSIVELNQKEIDSVTGWII